jgi:hypothetical protein
MMKLLVPLVIALVGLGAGVGAGIALKPAPEEHAGAEAACEHPPCEDAAPDPFAAGGHDRPSEDVELAYVPLQKPFVVPVFDGEKVVAMVVLSLSVEVPADHEPEAMVEAIEPRLRDGLLKAMFLHANSDGFNGTFTTGRKIEDLKASLLASARQVMGRDAVFDVLITDIARQDV